MVDGNIEEALNLRRVQVNEEGAVGAGGGQQVGDELGADGHAGTVLAILARVAVIGNHHRDARCRGPLERVNHHQQLHQMLVHRVAGGLDDKNIDAAHVLQQLKVNFAVGKALHLGFAHLNPNVSGDLLGQRPVGRAAEKFEPFVLAQVAAPLALGDQFGLPRLCGSIRSRQSEYLWGGVFVCAITWRLWLALLLCHFVRLRHCFRFHLRIASKLVGFGVLFTDHCSLTTETLAGRPGFEPGQVPPKGTVLPLDDRPTMQPTLSCASADCQPLHGRSISRQYSVRGRVWVNMLRTSATRKRSRAASASPRVLYNPKSAEPDPDSEAWRAASGVPEAASMRLISAREGCWGKTTRSKSFSIQLVIPVRTSADSIGPARFPSSKGTPEEPAPSRPSGIAPAKALA